MSNCTRTVTSTETVAQTVAAALAAYNGPIHVVPGFDGIKPRSRSTWVDPEAKLKRNKRKNKLVGEMTEAERERKRSQDRARHARNKAALKQQWAPA